MNIYTGMFYRANKYIQNGLIPISIAGYSPKWYEGIQYKKLAPKWSFFNDYKHGLISELEYVDKFNLLVLDELSQSEVISDLHKLIVENNPDIDLENCKIVLLCYESVGNFCHRHLVMDWLRNSEFADDCCGEYEEGSC